MPRPIRVPLPALVAPAAVSTALALRPIRRPFAAATAGWVVSLPALEVPLHIGAPDVAFPRLNALAYWLFTFGSLIAAGLPLLVGVVGVGIGIAGIFAATSFTDTISNFTPTLASMIGLAVGIDYALFIVSRFRTELVKHIGGNDLEPRELAQQLKTIPFRERAHLAGLAVGKAGSAVVFAGLTVLIALAALSLLGLAIFGPGIANGIVSGGPQLGAGAAAGTALAAGGALIGGAIDSLSGDDGNVDGAIIGAVLPGAYAEQLGHARLGPRAVAAERPQRGPHPQQPADRRQRDRVADLDPLFLTAARAVIAAWLLAVGDPAMPSPARSPFTSATNTGTPAAESCSAISWSVLVLPVPVAPATRPCRFIEASGRRTCALASAVPSTTAAPRVSAPPSNV